MTKAVERVGFCMAGIEKTFNALECVPVLASYSGGARCALGQLQVITGIALGAFATIACRLTKTPAWRHQCRLLMKDALELTIHGIANIIRGIAASKLFIGPLLFVTYDLMGCRFRYHAEDIEWKQERAFSSL